MHSFIIHLYIVGSIVCYGFVSVPIIRSRREIRLNEGRFYGKSKPSWRTASSLDESRKELSESSKANSLYTDLRREKSEDLKADYLGNVHESGEDIDLERRVWVSPKGTARIVKVQANAEDESDAIAKLMSREESNGGQRIHEKSIKSIMLFLPGLDGIGSYSENTLRSLISDYDVYQMKCASNDRSTFLELEILSKISRICSKSTQVQPRLC